VEIYVEAIAGTYYCTALYCTVLLTDVLLRRESECEEKRREEPAPLVATKKRKEKQNRTEQNRTVSDDGMDRPCKQAYVWWCEGVLSYAWWWWWLVWGLCFLLLTRRLNSSRESQSRRLLPCRVVSTLQHSLLYGGLHSTSTYYSTLL